MLASQKLCYSGADESHVTTYLHDDQEWLARVTQLCVLSCEPNLQMQYTQWKTFELYIALRSGGNNCDQNCVPWNAPLYIWQMYPLGWSHWMEFNFAALGIDITSTQAPVLLEHRIMNKHQMLCHFIWRLNTHPIKFYYKQVLRYHYCVTFNK